MRWFYYYPTWNKPSGGNKQLRLMAILLAELGVETYLLRDQKFFAPGGGFDDNVFYHAAVPLAPFTFEEAGNHLKAEDVLILPEVLLDTTLPRCQSWPCRIALNNQNGYFGLRYGAPRQLCASRLEFAIANAPYVAALCRDFHGFAPERVFDIPYWVARPPFAVAQDEQPRTLGICYMPRKLPDEGKLIREQVQATHQDVPWVEIDHVPEDEVARRIRKHSLFFAAQDLEGFGLPALEAMACGSLVAGFAGTGAFAHPYATPENGLWAPDRNIPAAVRATREAIAVVRQGGERYQKYLAAGRKTAERFTREAVLESLRDFVKVVESRAYQSRRSPAPRLGWRGKLYAYRMLYNYDKLGWPGRVVSWLSDSTKPVRAMLARR
jgi:glycosyltransferase involved in cell wall biosynthesis